MKSQIYINDFANRSFRDVADQDYIAARMSYRAELPEPFLWSSLQCLEKYFKAILLYNRKTTKGINHNIEEALIRVEAINDIGFKIPKDVKDFAGYLNTFGTNRYLEHSTILRLNALLGLDRSVWHIRRYCYYMRGTIKNSDNQLVELLPYEVKKVNNEMYIKKPHTYEISGGYLEKILNKKGNAYFNLVWHNFYYGKRKKKKIKNHKLFVSNTNPTLTMHPEAFDELDELVKFSKYIRRQYKKK